MPNVHSQRYELARVDELKPHPDNPRRGNVDVIRDSIRSNDFFGACVVQQSTNRIIIGVHRWLAAKDEELEKIPVLFVDVSDETAARIMIADNRVGDLAEWDEEQLVELLESLAATDEELAGTGFTDADLAKMRADDFAPEDENANRLDQRQTHECPQCSFQWRIGPRGEVEPV